MKLVEILAQELEMWPEGALVLSQLENGYICKPGESSFDEPITVVYYDLAEDWSSAVVTRPQWQAERDRMKAMEKIEQGVKQFENDVDSFARMVSAPLQEPTYEQQLWDRVAIQQLDKLTVDQEDAFENLVRYAANRADAFIAERAKRVGK